MTIFKAASYTKSSELRCNLEILKVSVQYLKYKSNDSKLTYRLQLWKIVLLLDLPFGFKEILQKNLKYWTKTNKNLSLHYMQSTSTHKFHYIQLWKSFHWSLTNAELTVRFISQIKINIWYSYILEAMISYKSLCRSHYQFYLSSVLNSYPCHTFQIPTLRVF